MQTSRSSGDGGCYLATEGAEPLPVFSQATPLVDVAAKWKGLQEASATAC